MVRSEAALGNPSLAPLAPRGTRDEHAPRDCGSASQPPPLQAVLLAVLGLAGGGWGKVIGAGGETVLWEVPFFDDHLALAAGLPPATNRF